VRENQSGSKGDKNLGQLQYHSNIGGFPADAKQLVGTTKPGHYALAPTLTANEKGNIILGDVSITADKGEHGMGVIIKRSITLPKLPFPKLAWFKGDIIQDNEQTRQALIEQYQYVWNALHHKEASKLKPLFTQRNKIYSKAYYEPVEQFDVVKSLEDDSHNKNMVLGGFTPKYQHLKIIGNNRLAKLVLWDGGPSIFFNDKDGNGSNSYDITFAKIKGKWQVVR
jgi:hypothetical protein